MKYFFWLLTVPLVILADNIKPILWFKIPKFQVNNTINDFVNAREITDCFEYQENVDSLYLKCLIKGKIININIHISDEDSIYIYKN
jgi:hypothetical protein